MDSKELKTLLHEKGGPCISVILPMVTTSPDRQQNAEVIRKAVRKVKSILEARNIREAERDLLLMQLDLLIRSIDTVHVAEGLGLFVSHQCASKVLFPFTVKTVIAVEETFETRNLIHLLQYMSSYYVLLVSKKDIRLFNATGNDLKEIKDGHFPLHYEDEYEYEKPGIGPGIQTVSRTRVAAVKDKSTIINRRIQSFFAKADGLLSSKTDKPVVVAATKKLGTDFISASSHPDRMVGHTIGSFDDETLVELALKAFEAFAGHKRKIIKQHIRAFEEAKGEHRIAQGIQEVWEAAHEGRGLHLLVDKEYYARGYQRNGDPQLWLRPPKGSYRLIADAVDEIIETVLKKKGNVTFVENNELKKMDHIALLLRY